MNLTIRQFRAFLAVADLRSFTAASKYLCITQGAVSGLINEMESQMEVSLFDRTSRVVKLSPDGEKFLPAAMRVVEEFQRAENYARDLKEIKIPGAGCWRAADRLCFSAANHPCL